MVEEPDNLILQYLRRFDARLARLEEDMQDVKVRLGSIESQLTTLRVDMTQSLHRLDKMDERLLRIERRSGLAEVDGERSLVLRNDPG